MNDYFELKTAGGAGSQLIALMNGILISELIHKPFRVKHYPSSTGTYFPCAIEHLLSPDEIYDLSAPMPGMDLPSASTTAIGSILPNHPLEAGNFNRTKLTGLLTRFGLDVPLKRLRGEWEIDYSSKRLFKTPKGIRCVTGGYLPYFNEIVETGLSERLSKSELSRLIPKFELHHEFSAVIHFRLGDKRESFTRKKLQIDGVVDPVIFRELLVKEGRDLTEEVIVVSDEPDLAVKLLKNVGINSRHLGSKNDVWKDLQTLTNSDLLICSWSAISQVAACISVQKNAKVYYPKHTSTGFIPKWQIPGVNLYHPSFVNSDFEW